MIQLALPAVFWLSVASSDPATQSTLERYLERALEYAADDRPDDVERVLLKAAGRATTAADRERVYEGYSRAAHHLLEHGRFDRALSLYEAGFEGLESLHEGEHPVLVEASVSIGLVLIALWRLDEALPWFRRANDLAARVEVEDEIIQAAGLYYGSICEWNNAQRTAAVALQRRFADMPVPVVVETRLWMSDVLRTTGKHDVELRLARVALELAREAFGEEHPTTLDAMLRVADALEEIANLEGREVPEEARRLRADTARRAEHLQDVDPRLAIRFMDESHYRHVKREEVREALQTAHASIRTANEHGLEVPQYKYDSMTMLVTLLVMQLTNRHDFSESVPLVEDSLEIMRAAKPTTGNMVSLFMSEHYLGMAYGVLGWHEDAIAVYRDAIARIRGIAIAGFRGIIAAPATGIFKFSLAESLSRAGRTDEVMVLYEEAERDSRTLRAMMRYAHLYCGIDTSWKMTLARMIGGTASTARKASIAEDLARRGVPGSITVWRKARAEFENLLRSLATQAGRDMTALMESDLRLQFGTREIEILAQIGREEEALRMANDLRGDLERIVGSQVDWSMDGSVVPFLDAISRNLDSVDWSGRAIPILEDALREYSEALSQKSEAPSPEVLLARTMQVQINLAEAYSRAGRTQEARRAIQKLVAWIEEFRGSGAGTDLRQQARRFSLVDDLVTRARDVLLDLDDAEQALILTERTRGRALLDLMERNKFEALDSKDVPSSEVERGKELLRKAGAEVARCQRELLVQRLREVDTEAAERALSNAQRELRKARRRWDALVRDALPAAARPADLDVMRGLVRRGQIMLYYVLTTRSAHVFVVPPEPDPIEALRLSADTAEIEDAVDAWTRQISRGALGGSSRGRPALVRPSLDTEAGRRLAALILPEELFTRIRKARRVWIIPDGALHRLPFETLVVGGSSTRPKYWLDRGPPIAYAPSASVLAAKAIDRPRPKPALELVALGDPTFQPHSSSTPPITPEDEQRERFGGLAPLPGTRREVREIADLFPSSRVRTLLGADATEARLRQVASSCRYLHLASHGLAHEFRGQSFSALALTAGDRQDQDDDGLLRLEDLLATWRGGLEPCRLVVLSACDTAVGDEIVNEAPHALPIGFLVAGADAVVASLWRVRDDLTADLMIEFYRRLAKNGSRPLAALNAARKAIRRDNPEPFAWGAFLFIGSP